MAKRTVKTERPQTEAKNKPVAVTPAIPKVAREPELLSAADLDQELLEMQQAVPVAPPVTNKKAERSEVALDDEALVEARCFIPAKVCLDYVDAYSTTHKKLLETHLRDLYIQTMWARKSQPENPAVKIRDDKGLVEGEMVFVLQDRFSVQMPEVGEKQTPADAMREFLIVSGMDPQNAAKLVTNELTWKVEQSIPLSGEVDAGDPQNAARINARVKLIRFLRGKTPTLELDDTERALLVIARTHKAEVRDGFLERAALYASNIEELKLILNIIKPIAQHRGAKAWDNFDPAIRREKLIDTFRMVLGDGGKPKK